MLFKNNIIFFSLFFILCSFSGTLLTQQAVETESQQGEPFEAGKTRLTDNASPASVQTLEDARLQECLCEKDALECFYGDLYKKLLDKGRTKETEKAFQSTKTSTFKSTYCLIQETIKQVNLNCSDLELLKYAISYRYNINECCSIKKTVETNGAAHDKALQYLEYLFELWEQYTSGTLNTAFHRRRTNYLTESLKRDLSSLSDTEQLIFHLYSDAHHEVLKTGK
jgi:hypothetical protein